MSRWTMRTLGIALSVAALLLTAESQAAQPIEFNRSVRPILSANCFACHGFDDKARKAKLRLDIREGATGPAKSGEPAIVPGKPEASELIKRLLTMAEDDVMPPPETHKKVKPDEIEVLKQWISEGAQYSKHWSFEKPVKAALPKIKKSNWPSTDFDAFILARLEREKLSPAPQADKAALARRAALDIVGIPPEPAKLDAFLKDSSKDAFERYVDGLLASPQFGERWARHWLDLARFADTKGYEKDQSRTIWRWRDWVIAAFNADMPYDEFTRQQVAGDLLPNATPEQILATAFHRNTLTNEEGGVDGEEFRSIAVKDRVDTTAQVWMGLTMGCAKCHSHKYDPISQQDYYRFYAFFNQTEDANRGDESPRLATPTANELQKDAKYKEALAAAELRLKELAPKLASSLPAWETEAKALPAWRVAKPKSMTAASGAKLTLQSDESMLATGKLPEKEKYDLKFDAPGGKLTALRLETLTDKANPKNAVGRAKDDGNFVLSGISVSAKTPDGRTIDIQFTKAEATHSQANYPVTDVLKNPDLKKKGWAVAPKMTEPQTAIFITPQAYEIPAGSELTVTLDHQFEYSYPGFVIGRFRISFTNDARPKLAPGLAPVISEILALAPDQRNDAQRTKLLEHFATVAPETKAIRDEIAKIKKQISDNKFTETPILRELPEAKRRVTKVHNRGNFLDPGEVVQAATPAAFHAFPTNAPKNRAGVADWFTSPENPLTARVEVNRVWAHLFGRGLVETEEDFGASGTLPTHPEVLDWLAVDFVEHGWSVKRLIKTIVLSSTYRQSSVASRELIARDRDNRLLARGPRFRLESEMLRDQALAVSGLLSSKIGGPSVMPYQPPGLWKSTYNSATWQISPGEDKYRRGIYTFVKRTTPHPQMVTFDGTSRETCTIRRIRTNTPLQALELLNDPVFVECAQALAREMSAHGKNPEEQIAWGFKRALMREAKSRELSALLELYRQRLAESKNDLAAATKFATEPLGPLSKDADVAHSAALTAIANVLLNLDEFLTKG